MYIYAFPAAQGPVFVQDAQKGFLSSGKCDKNLLKKSQKMYKMYRTRGHLCKMTRKKLHNAKNDLCNLTRAEAGDPEKSIGKIHKNCQQNARSGWWSFGQICGRWCPDCADRTNKVCVPLVKNLLRKWSWSFCADRQYQRKKCTKMIAGRSGESGILRYSFFSV